MTEHKEPKVSFLVLDYQKPNESLLLLNSIKQHVKFPHKVIYLHNGPSDYAKRFMDLGLVDQLIVTSKNNGLGIGTRDLFAACFTEFAIYVQNDQILGRDFEEAELDGLISMLLSEVDGKWITSISLAGAPCGQNVYSERAHLIRTIQYRFLEKDLFEIMKEEWSIYDCPTDTGLPDGGAGPYHDQPWREGWMQQFYRSNNYIHWVYPNQMFIDNGVYAVRQSTDGSLWVHRTDNKKLWNIIKPKEVNSVYPKLTNEEWQLSLTSGWKDGDIPAKENNPKDSFKCWNQSPDDDKKYVEQLRQINNAV